MRNESSEHRSDGRAARTGVAPALLVVLMGCCGAVWAQETDARSGGVESHHIEVQGAKVHYLAAGPADGMPVVLLHGGRFNSETWLKTKTIGALQGAGFRVFAVDLPGFGKSPRAKINRSTFLANLLAKLSPKRAVIVSPSMSGRFSMPLVTAHPELVAGFVAVAPVGIQAHKDQLKNITTPTLLIWGENDRTIPLADADLLASSVPGARKIVFQGARHPCYLDEPDRFNRELIAFVSALAKRDTSAAPAE